MANAGGLTTVGDGTISHARSRLTDWLSEHMPFAGRGLLWQHVHFGIENLFPNGVKVNSTWLRKGKGEKHVGANVCCAEMAQISQSKILVLAKGVFKLFLLEKTYKNSILNSHVPVT